MASYVSQDTLYCCVLELFGSAVRYCDVARLLHYYYLAAIAGDGRVCVGLRACFSVLFHHIIYCSIPTNIRNSAFVLVRDALVA